ncbi:MAG: aminotransferase class I/II-fold pyridoxal phosphate-dependent enzyme [Thermoplasmata archaeon]|nr:aminotransferase class I/II-fold pyridoxal phosphate-dependent enzyme [Thermoplasmata archaeon]
MGSSILPRVSALPKIPGNPRSLEIEYAIRDIVLPALELEKQGHQILKLNIGDPNKYDFDTPQFIKDAVTDAMNRGMNGYSPSTGYPEMLDAIVADEASRGTNITVDDIVVTNGVTEALQLIFYAALEPGDEVLIPGPSYPPYNTYVEMMGAKAVEYRTIEEEGWVPDVEDIRSKITGRTKAIAIINPNNPTGALYDGKSLKEVCDLIAEHPGIFIISDEIYNLMTFDEETAPTSRYSGEVPMIVLNGISKIYLAPGWRIGYLAIRDPRGDLADIRDGIMRQCRSRLCANSITEYGYLAALMGPRGHIRETMEKLRKRRDLSHRRLNQIDGLSCQNIGGAFYMFPRIDCLEQGPWKDDKEFALDLLHSEKVLTVFGSGFGKLYGKDHFRIVILPQEEVLEDAFDRIERFIRRRVDEV